MKKQMQTTVKVDIAKKFEEKASLIGLESSTLLFLLISNFLSEPFELSIQFSSGKKQKGEELQTVTVTVPQKMHQDFAKKALESGQTIRNLLRLLITDFVLNKTSLTLNFKNK